MKKHNLIIGVGYIILGIILIAVSMRIDNRLSSLLFGFSGGCIGPGIMMIYKYFYWNAPKNRQKYQEKLEHESIELHDELKVKLRDKSGRYTYLLGLVILCVSIVIFAILGQLNIVDAHITILFLYGYLIFQIIAGILIFKHLLKKY